MICFEEQVLIKLLIFLKYKKAKDLLLRRGNPGLRFEILGLGF